MENKIIGLDLNTKLQYSIFNFFAPISITTVAINTFELYNVASSLAAFLSVIVGLCILIFNLVKYNRYIVINDNSIIICTGKKNPKVLETIKIAELNNEKLGLDFCIMNRGKKIKLLHVIPSVTALICWVGPLIFIPLVKRNNLTYDKLSEIKTLLPEIIQDDITRIGKSPNALVEILMWGFVLFGFVVGSIGILLMPFYPFMGTLN